jgi:hypothetical protein
MSYSDDFWKHIYYSPEGSDFFPFEKNSFINWVNTNYGIKETEKFTTDDIFNKELIKVVFDVDFSNNDISFNTSTINTEHGLVQACIDGEVKVSCAYYESSVSAYNTSADNTFSDVSGIDHNNISYNEDNGITTVTYGGSTYEYGTHGGTCALHKNCTGTHLHYNNCALQTIKNADGDSMCKCVCDGGIKLGDGTTHTHCGTLSKITEVDGEQSTVKLVFTTGGGTGETITTTYTDPEEDPSIDTVVIAGQTRDDLYIIYAKYYYELYRNKFLNSNMNRTFDTSKKAVNDATTKYKREYVLLYDYITGIFLVSGFIYFMYNEKF